MDKSMHNFNAGPSILPEEVFKEASEAVINFNNSGLSILEIGHRTPEFTEIMEKSRSLIKELMGLNDNYEVLFLHGGASTQFFQIPMNLLDQFETAAYADTGVWSLKAIKEAGLFGNVDVICSSKENNYNFIPNEFTIPENAKYLHITTNNTIYGTQWKNIPDTEIPIVADMSSDILSRSMDFSKFSLIYAGAQKNLGCAGATIVIINKNILGKVERVLPTMMDYRNHIKEHSLLNTPPVFAVYVSYLTLKWLKKQGGVKVIEKLNDEKADLLYSEIERNTQFTGTAEPKDRSKMNICFVGKNKDVEEKFLEYSKTKYIYGIKGHRSVGGFRASSYNALKLESVQVLIQAMQEFEQDILKANSN
ncbi:MAG: 3-phosphoserine/phosphohydroxythreonine transaminase [Ferruginibacter sp.]